LGLGRSRHRANGDDHSAGPFEPSSRRSTSPPSMGPQWISLGDPGPTRADPCSHRGVVDHVRALYRRALGSLRERISGYVRTACRSLSSSAGPPDVRGAGRASHDRLCESGWHGVADTPTEGSELHRGIWVYETRSRRENFAGLAASRRVTVRPTPSMRTRCGRSIPNSCGGIGLAALQVIAPKRRGHDRNDYASGNVARLVTFYSNMHFPARRDALQPPRLSPLNDAPDRLTRRIERGPGDVLQSMPRRNEATTRSAAGPGSMSVNR
jgi:hypothetical protein